MTRIAVICLALLMTAAPLGEAVAQDRGQRARPERRQDAERPQFERPQFERPQISMAEAAQRASAGRPGRFLGASNRSGTVVVRWEYPGGRVADIMVDARTGRIVGER